jgi:YegS/Rv2252/BmrU family lipid kinase
MNKMNFTFIINPYSGLRRNKSNLPSLIEEKVKNDFEIVYTEYAGHASAIAKTALSNGSKNIIAIGGDGTMNEVATALVGTDSNFGLIPMGSGNGFARSLRLPLNSEKALDVIVKANLKKIDVGKINEHHFFCVAGIGFDAEVAQQFQKRKIRGAIPYFFIGLKELSAYTYPAYFLKNAEKELKVNPLLITFANGTEFGNGAKIAPYADMQDGKLDVCIFSKMSIFRAILESRKMFNGRIKQIKSYSTFLAENVTVFADTGNFTFHTDGEPHTAEKSVDVKIIPHALNVIVPD